MGRAAVVFPTGVGVYRRPDGHAHLVGRFPHRRGGVPLSSRKSRWAKTFSPQAWGCTDDGGRGIEGGRVFPTGVGVYRGAAVLQAGLMSFSPQAWGCTVFETDRFAAGLVFPTGVGVYRGE